MRNLGDKHNKTDLSSPPESEDATDEGVKTRRFVWFVGEERRERVVPFRIPRDKLEEKSSHRNEDPRQHRAVSITSELDRGIDRRGSARILTP